jgi:hypothetical protein
MLLTRYAGVVMLVPLIQYSSTFVKTAKFAKFYADPEMHKDAIKFVILDKGKI